MSDTDNLIERRARELAADMLSAAHGSDADSRSKQAEQWGYIRAFMENQSYFNQKTEKWQHDHQREDDNHFEILDQKIDSKLGGISSSVDGVKSESEVKKGERRAVLYIIAGFGWLITTGIALWAVFK